MIKKVIAGILLAQMGAIAYGQDISSSSSVTLPMTGQLTYQVSDGQTTTVSSKEFVQLNPGTLLASGSNVSIYILDRMDFPAAPYNPVQDYNKNWVYARTYDDDGNENAAVKSFFDDSGNLVQTQSKDESRNHVLAVQTLYDFQQRAVAKTLPAPVNNAAFAYKNDFITGVNGGMYDYQHFDGDPVSTNPTYLSKIYAADPVNDMNQGTVGWYYSNNNILDSNVGITSFPYNRVEYYRNGLDLVKRSSGVGDEMRLGLGHETRTFSFPVLNELQNYLEIREKINLVTPLGSSPVYLSNSAMQKAYSDENGKQGLVINDLSGKQLMSALINTPAWLTVNNNITLNNKVEKYIFQLVTESPQMGGAEDGKYLGIRRFSIRSDLPIKVTRAGTVIYNGTGNNYIHAQLPLGYEYVITSEHPFYLTAIDDDGSYFYDNVRAKVSEPNKSSVYYLELFEPSVVNISGLATVYDLKTESPLSFTSGSILPKGLYMFQAISGDVLIAYSKKLSDISYNFYNSLGQLILALAPNGVKAYLSNPGLYNGNNLPFATRYEYTPEGQLAASITTDGGRVEYIYRKDGKIRFSQNAVQRIQTSSYLEKYSYINYDQLGRPTEEGEYVIPAGNPLTFENLKSNTLVLNENSGGGGLSGGTKLDAVYTFYDTPAGDITLSGYVQDAGFLKGEVSKTSNQHSTTWFNYDDQGRLVWMVKKINGITAEKTIDYTYNAQGNVTKVDYQKNNQAERFVHYYNYDADGRLIDVKTSRDDATKLLHAKYYYYLHGPLKRMELGDNLQGIDYVYTVDGKLKSINHSSGDPSKDPGKDGSSGNSFLPDAFGMQFEYYPNDYVRSNTNINSIATGETNYYNGNVNGISWQSKKPSTMMSDPGNSGLQNPTMYTYNYDPNYQLKNAKWGTPNFSNNSFAVTQKYPGTGNDGVFQERNITYDANGNILTMQRTDANAAVSDNFSSYQYEPNSNKLTSVVNYANYTYDELGQLKTQTKAGITTYVKYDVTGKITGVYSDPTMTTPLVEYKYDESGNRIKVSITNSGTTTHDYYIYDASGNVLAMYTGSAGMVLSEVPVYGSDRLGIYRVSDGRHVYEMRDNVGSVKVVINRNRTSGGQLDVIQYNDYYPFGSIARQGGDGYKYEYQGAYAEKDSKTGWSNFDLRAYDGKIGRWLSFDPEGQYHSPYKAMGNDPVTVIDASGGYDSRWQAWLASGFGLFRDIYQNTNIDDVNYKQYYYSWQHGYSTLDGPVIEASVPNYGSGSALSQQIDRVTADIVRANYESSLKLGEHNKYTGYVKGSGAVEANYIEFEVALAIATSGTGNAAIRAGALTEEIVVEELIVHGNSLKSLRPTWGYKLYTKEGEFLKNGITSKLKPESRYTRAFMKDKVMKAELFPNRLEAYQWEYQQNVIMRGPLNNNMH